MKEKLRWLIAVTMFCAIFLTGCGETKMPEVIDGQTIYIGKEGEVTLWLVMDFQGADYKLSELTSMAVEEAAQYNVGKTQENIVAVEKVEALAGGDKAAITYKFGDWKSCSGFIGNDFFFGTNELFYGTVQEALSEGYGSKVIMKNVKDNTLFTEEQLRQAGESRLIVTDMGAKIYCPGKVAYISDGAKLNEDGSVDTFGVEGLAYILLK